MALFPSIGSIPLTEDERQIRDFIEMSYSQAQSQTQGLWAEWAMDNRFEAGDSSAFNEVYGPGPSITRRQMGFNHMRKIGLSISGHQRKNRKSVIVVPRENSSQDTADQYTKLIMHAVESNNMLHTFSDAFHQGAVIGGMGFLNVWLDFRDDPVSGDPKLDYVALNSIVCDPFFRKKDLSDCNFMWRRQLITKPDAISLNKDYEDLIVSLPGIANGTYDGKFQYMPENYSTHNYQLVTYDEFYYKDFRQAVFLTDTRKGETMEWVGTKDELDNFMRMFPEIYLEKTMVPTVNQAILIQGKMVYNSQNTLGLDSYPFIPLLGYFNPDLPYYSNRIQSVMRNLRDAQYLYNRRKGIELAQLESTVNTGWKFKEDALVDPRSVYMYGQGRGIALKKNASMDDVQQIPAPVVPPTTIQLSEILAAEMPNISGVTEELMGANVEDMAGVLSMMRQSAGLTTLQLLFDNADLALKLLGNTLLKVIQKNYAPGKVERIIGDEISPEFYNKKFGKYDAVVEEGANTSTQRQLQFAQLVQFKQMNIAVSAVDEMLVESSTLQNKSKLIQAIQAEKQKMQQAQETQMQMAQQEMQANIRLADANSAAQQAMGVERLSRVSENQAMANERSAAAAKDRDIALVNLIKAAKELDSMDIDDAVKMIQVMRSMKDQQDLDEDRRTASTKDQSPLAGMQQQQSAQGMQPQGGMSQALM